jgi:hypothetical protein
MAHVVNHSESPPRFSSSRPFFQSFVLVSISGSEEYIVGGNEDERAGGNPSLHGLCHGDQLLRFAVHTGTPLRPARKHLFKHVIFKGLFIFMLCAKDFSSSFVI